MRITVVGDGKWGTALGSLLTHNKIKFDFWKIGEDLPSNSTFIMCIPTQAIREVLEKNRKVKNITYINAAKGIEQGSHKFPHEIAREILGKNIDYFTLIGPSFADEVVDEMPTIVNVGFTNKMNVEVVRSLFETDYFRVKLAMGVEILELASAFKNIYAIACGIATGLGFEANTRAKLIVLAMSEFNKLARKMSLSISDEVLPGVVGDLILTCNSEESRNFSFGELLVKNDAETALAMIGQTVEGYFTVESVPHFEKKTGVDLPLARFVYDTIKNDDPSSVKKSFQNFVKQA
ncbi:MAG TPA: NAD(P)H-dependent glycerol-3-phosphate dehydrogenase [Patescibacteria group bacterium]|nr:NAD(P)H-dependent glycerol-3-phosphate dehydrogenase [Patescibacteria group bacterium]